MVLDPFTSLSLAGNVVQFVDFGSRLVSEAHEAYRSSSGISRRNEQLLASAERFKRLSERLTQSTAQTATWPSEDRQAITQIADCCQKTVGEFIGILETLRVEGSNRRWKSVKLSVRAAIKKERIEEIWARMEELRRETSLQFVAMLR
jgi:hypothetical protein